MDLKDYLTNEKVTKKFKSQFELVNYAIKLAANMIMTGRDSRVKTDNQNRAMQILSEILNDKDRFDEIIEREPEPLHRFEPLNIQDEDNLNEKPAKSERKKSRKILAN